jgi:hypothetical protein
MSRCARACQRRQRKWRLRSRLRRSENIESERTVESIGFGRQGQELMVREPELILKVWQTTTSTALFG